MNSLVSAENVAQLIAHLEALARLFRAPILLELGVYAALSFLFLFFLAEVQISRAAVSKYKRVCLADLENPRNQAASRDEAAYALRALKLHSAIAVACGTAIAVLLVVRTSSLG